VRCAIYDPMEGLQIRKIGVLDLNFGFVQHVAHALGGGVGWGGR